LAGDWTMEGLGLTVNVLFDLAHFRVHTTMKGRSSYLLPLPTTIIGFFFSILGKSRKYYIEERKNFKAGARIIDIGGVCRENAQLLKLKTGREDRTTEEIMLLLRPKYKFAIWGNRETIYLLYKKLNSFEFEFTPYAGINDFIFFDIKTPKIYEHFEETYIVKNSYVPKNIIDSIELSEKSTIYNLPYMYSGKPEFVIMGVNVSFKLKNKIMSIEGVPLYDYFLTTR